MTRPRPPAGPPSGGHRPKDLNRIPDRAKRWDAPAPFSWTTPTRQKDVPKHVAATTPDGRANPVRDDSTPGSSTSRPRRSAGRTRGATGAPEFTVSCEKIPPFPASAPHPEWGPRGCVRGGPGVFGARRSPTPRRLRPRMSSAGASTTGTVPTGPNRAWVGDTTCICGLGLPRSPHRPQPVQEIGATPSASVPVERERMQQADRTHPCEHRGFSGKGGSEFSRARKARGRGGRSRRSGTAIHRARLRCHFRHG